MITGADGHPMKGAHVAVFVPTLPTPLRIAAAASDGRYAIDIDSSGVWLLRFTGVGHRDLNVAVLVLPSDTVDLNVRLSSSRYLPSFDHCAVLGSFNRWYILSAIPMHLQPDSTYLAEVTSDSDTLEYCITGAGDGQLIPGTFAESYRYDPQRGYVAVVAGGRGTVRLFFDPRRLVRSEQPPDLSFTHASPTVSRFTAYYNELIQSQDHYLTALRDSVRAGRFNRQLVFDWSRPMGTVRRELADENIHILREELFVEYLTFANAAKVYDRGMIDSALREVGPASVVWSLNPHLIFEALGRSSLAPAERSRYVDDVIEMNPVVATKAALLFDEAMVARLSGDNALSDKFGRILVDRFGTSAEAAIVKKNGILTPPLVLGKPVPRFSVISIDDSTRRISNETLKGRWYLLEFWASKNEASAAQRQYLAAAYSKFKRKKFVIVSLSVDDSISDVIRFRKTRSAMPWLNAFLGRDPENLVVRAFDAYDVPKAILVDPKGNLVSMGDELFSDHLAVTLRKYLGR